MSIHTYEWNYEDDWIALVEYEHTPECKGHGSHKDCPEYVSVIDIKATVPGQSVYAMMNDKQLLSLEDKVMNHFESERKEKRADALIEAYIYSRGE